MTEEPKMATAVSIVERGPYGVPSNAAMKQVHDFAGMLCRAGWAPYGVDTPEKVAIAIIHGAEVGLPPMQAVQRIAVLNGRPVIWGDAVPALVERSGLLEKFSESFEGTPYEDGFTAVCTVKRKGREQRTERYSVADAKIAKLWMKRGGPNKDKDTPWITAPKRMLRMRARAFAFRDEFSDVLGGLYFAEEMIGMGEDNALKTIDSMPADSGGPALPEPSQSATTVRAGGPSSITIADIPSIPAAASVSTTPQRQGQVAALQSTVLRTGEPASASLDALSEILDEEEPETQYDRWLERISTATYDEAVEIIEREVYPAQERAQLTAQETEQLIQAALGREGR